MCAILWLFLDHVCILIAQYLRRKRMHFRKVADCLSSNVPVRIKVHPILYPATIVVYSTLWWKVGTFVYVFSDSTTAGCSLVYTLAPPQATPNSSHLQLAAYMDHTWCCQGDHTGRSEYSVNFQRPCIFIVVCLRQVVFVEHSEAASGASPVPFPCLHSARCPCLCWGLLATSCPAMRPHWYVGTCLKPLFLLGYWVLLWSTINFQWISTSDKWYIISCFLHEELHTVSVFFSHSNRRSTHFLFSSHPPPPPHLLPVPTVHVHQPTHPDLCSLPGSLRSPRMWSGRWFNCCPLCHPGCHCTHATTKKILQRLDPEHQHFCWSQ